MASITPIKDVEDSVQSTASTSYADVSCETAALADGVSYLVFAHGCSGADTSSRLAFLQVLHGATQIGEAGGEAAFTGDLPYHSGKLAFVDVVTGDGSSTLKFQLKTSAGTARAGAMFLIAIPMTDMGTEGVDWHASYTDSTTKVVNDVGSATDVLSETWDFGSSQDWMIFGSFESLAGGLTTGRSTHTTMTFGASELDCVTNREAEDVLDIESAFFFSMETLSGSVAVALTVRGDVASEVDARRPRLVAIRKDHWNQVVHANYESTRVSTTSATYGDLGELDLSITNVESGAEVLSMWGGNCGLSSFATVALSQIRNDTAGTVHCVDAGMGCNNNGDDIHWSMMHCEALSVTTDYKPQIRSHNGVASGYWPSNSNERIQGMLWELSVPDTATATIYPLQSGQVF